MVDPIDEYAIQHVTEFGGEEVTGVEGRPKIRRRTGPEAKVLNFRKETFKPLTDYLKSCMVTVKVSISSASRTLPIIVTSQYGTAR